MVESNTDQRIVETEQQIAHLTMIQGVINRMAHNSFSIKMMSVTLSAGIIALVGAIQTPQPMYLLGAILPIFVFWWMDAKYLRQERLFRKLYDEVRNNKISKNYDMNIVGYKKDIASIFQIAFSWSVLPIYFILLVSFAILWIIIL